MAFSSFTEEHSTFNHALVAGLLGCHIVVGEVALSASYTTNGETVAATDLDADATSIISIICSPSTDGSVQASWDAANSKIQAYNTSDGAEVTATTDLTAAGKEFKIIAIMS